MGLRKGLLSLLSLAILPGSLAACLPTPEEPIEWVQREDAIIVQMKQVGGLPQPALMDRLTVPDFTLYGDGTLIFIRPEDRAQFPAGGPRLHQAKLPEEATGDLLEAIVDEGFLEFPYEQPRPGSRYDFPTTYLYVHTKTEANATSAYALDVPPPEDAGDEWKDFRRLGKIKRRLDELDPAAVGGRVLGSYKAQEILLMVELLALTEEPVQPPTWPVADVDLAALAPPSSGVVQKRFSVAEASELMAALPAGSYSLYRQGDRLFAAGYRPVLPHEENFPEFEGTQ